MYIGLLIKSVISRTLREMKTHRFTAVNPHVHFPDMEENILAYWKNHAIFEKSIDLRPENNPWTLLDGPPFITGMPHYGTLLSSIPKDIFPRYFTMKGYRVRRVWGWDCHGLPAENKVEQELSVKRKKDIEGVVGVKPFIDACKRYVQHVSGEWEWYVDHIGRWVDLTHSYKTMDRSYMESVMWVFRQMYDKGYIYKGLRVSLYCPHCATPISNFEVAMDPENYKEIKEPATTYKYALKDQKDTYILAWSTTPWNKIATPALAVNPSLTYVKVKQADAWYILAETTLGKLKDEPYEIVARMQGSDLVGIEFVPHFTFYPIEKGKKAYIILGGDFVTAQEGTGVVTIAAYGEEDLALMQKENVQIVQHIDEEGRLKPEVPLWGGMYYLDVNPLVDEYLKKQGLVYGQEQIVHTVPTCWRCHTRLIFAPQDAWYVDVQQLKPKLEKTNETVHWFPEHFKYGRYIKSVQSAPDWCISRSRYWGSPVPVWECACGERFVPGSIAELEARAKKTVTDLHKPQIDEITVVCSACGKTVHRVPEVLDSWIEAGSASFAERHFPFEQGVKLEDFYPPDFIAEYTGQIRAWFYVLHVIGVALFDSAAFKNVVVTGVILGTDGRKMSKNFGNYPDPKGLIQKYGGDALRLYLMGSPVMHGEDICISEEQYKLQVRSVLLLLWNVYNFFVMYALADGWNPGSDKSATLSSSILDIWIASRRESTVLEMTKYMDAYDTVNAIRTVTTFIEDLSQWYVRRSRTRIGPSVLDGDDKYACYQTLYDTLVNLTCILAPIAPFVTEEMYRNLTGNESVHLAEWPEVNVRQINSQLEEDMAYARQVVEKIHAKRKELALPVRQPLPEVVVEIDRKSVLKELIPLIQDEVNIRRVTCKAGGKEIVVIKVVQPTKELLEEGKMREAIRKIQMLRKEKKCTIEEKVVVTLPVVLRALPRHHLDTLMRETLATTIIWGDTYTISTSD